MLGAFVRAFRTPDLRRKLLFTLGIIIIYRIGSFTPGPGVDYTNVQQCVAEMSAAGSAGFRDLVNLFSGGALLQLSIFALGIMPYITASIIVQLLRVVIPRFEALQKEGASGTAKLMQYTRYITVGLSFLQGAVIVTIARTGNLFVGCTVGDQIIADGWFSVSLLILAVATGTVLLMWMGELITERGIGNGMSLLIFASIAASFPSAFQSIFAGQNGLTNMMIFTIIMLLIVIFVVFVEQSQRRIPVQYAKRMVGRRTYGGSTTYIPLKINMSSVIPVIFASSILALPTLAAEFGDMESPWVGWVSANLADPSSTLYIILYTIMIIFFAFFYTSIIFNPEEVADNMKRYGGFVPGIRAGKPTADYLDYVITRLTWPGSLYLAFVALIPVFVFKAIGVSQNIPFGGASVLIIVSVGLETVKQIQSQLEQRHYEGFLN